MKMNFCRDKMNAPVEIPAVDTVSEALEWRLNRLNLGKKLESVALVDLQAIPPNLYTSWLKRLCLRLFARGSVYLSTGRLRDLLFIEPKE